MTAEVDHHLQLYRFFDGELCGVDKKHFKRHLHVCRECQSNLNRLRIWRGAIRYLNFKPTCTLESMHLPGFGDLHSSGNKLPEKIIGFFLLYPFRTLSAAHILLILTGLLLGMWAYNPGTIPPLLAEDASNRSRGLFDAVYPGSLVEAYLLLEEQNE